MNPKLTLLILSVLSASALNVFAANKVVTAGQDVIETDQTYAAVTGYSALTVNGGTYTGTNIALSSTVAGRYGAYIYGQGALTLTGGTVTGNSDAGTVYGVDVINTSVARLENVSIDISGSGNTYGVIATYSSTVSVKGGSITLGGLGGSYGPRGLMALYGAQIHAEDLLVTINGRGTSIISERSGSLITLKNVTVNSLGTGLSVQYNASLIANQVTVTSELTGLRVNRGGTLILNDSLVTMTGENAVAVIAGDSQNNLIVNGGTLAGGAGLLHIDSNADSVNQVTLNNVDTTGVTGDNSINVADTDLSTTTVTINGGTGGLNGDVTNPGSGALTVNLNDSSLTGDIINTGDGTLTIILDNDSVGTGGYHGGNLITGSDSTWTFNKNSHGNYGQNDGVWNLGDYEVIFDNLTHTGTINISVNSDTGAGGFIAVTGTADGEGKVHIDTTGNGQLNPNDVLPGIVSGDGTENWQWDPIDWGIDTIIKDGDHFIKSGVSPAGAVLNSSVAIQQAMWFAQQNSLLKRMGELRYGARASRPLAGETPAFHNLIDNLWLRSYGQQLNVGSQVAGKAYEQFIYGVDLGTDHKFTINADSDLYLGVYAGYGRSDIDYRTPGTDGELNSYYGGLYATWL
ncbi:MAG: autotransporter domain-containing protein, partial [Verrucomicrobiales bacterium]|nr:autotransporter domain-containing protein [Verrucomicrobiales bacterium]